jgi:ABC-type uncharacterized transport system ATPase subunit|tara:strand:- start:241 stop:435 length:195 start_codon:yes stop_codon:yes gene_type:complete
MNTDKLKLFKTIDEVKHYARVNGYDEKDAQKMIKEWNSLGEAPKTVSKKVSMLTPEEDSLIEKK